MRPRWLSAATAGSCPACETHGAQEGIVAARSVALGAEVTFSRCAACGSLVADRVGEPSTTAALDYYLEQGAGVDCMIAPLRRIRRVRRLLEVGCGFGFVLDFARRQLGAEVVGVDPSELARAGREQLDLPIHVALFDERFPPDLTGFDAAIAIEMIEHASAPRPLLRALHARLDRRGVLFLSTPDAGAVTPDADPHAIVRLLSAGHHAVLFSGPALAAALSADGFPHQHLRSIDGRLRVYASPTARGLTRVGEAPHDDALLRYLDQGAESARRGSALAVGFASRHFKAAVSAARWRAAEVSFERLSRAFRERHRIPLDPERSLEELAALSVGPTEDRAPTPFALPAALYFRGMCDLAGGRPGGDAPAWLAAAEQTAGWIGAQLENAGIADGEIADLRLQAQVHHPIALAPTSPSKALELWERLECYLSGSGELGPRVLDRRRPQMFLALVHAGAYREAECLRRRVSRSLHTDDRDAVVPASQVLFGIAMLELHAGSRLEAAALFAAAARCAGDDRALASEARRHEAKCWENGAHSSGVAARAAVSAPVRPAGVHTPSPGSLALSLRYGLEAYWRDGHGVFVCGWVHAGARPIESLVVQLGPQEVKITTLPEAPELASAVGAGDPPPVRFRAYFPGASSVRGRLCARTEAGDVDAPLELPREPLPAFAEPPFRDPSRPTFAKWHPLLPPRARVLAIGTRRTGAAEIAQTLPVPSDARVVGLDVHPGYGVDLVGDVHSLGELFEACTFDAVISSAVLEHVAVPWVAAAQIQRVLRVGGLTYQAAPYCWPAHAEPNDYWRFSPQGLRVLFGPQTGFEVLEAAARGAAQLMPGPSWRNAFLDMPTVPAWAWSHIVARKIHELPAGAVSWPADALSYERASRTYPIDGLTRETGACSVAAPAADEGKAS